MYTAQIDQLDAEGYTVFRDFLPLAFTARLRAHMDSLLPPIDPPQMHPHPVTRTLRHPIPGAIMAEALTPRLVALAQEILGSTRLRLLEQVLIRSDPCSAPRGAGGWHVDQVFHPSQYFTRPRLTYYHFVHALNTVPAGGAAFTIVPGSHKKNYERTANLTTKEELRRFHGNVTAIAADELKNGIEVLARDGDLIVFNPMALHSGSNNVTLQPRYVYFASFADVNAEYLWAGIRESNYGPYFSDDLKNNIRPEWRDMLEGQRVSAPGVKSSMS
ncbi:MAG: phytanoyl-CoA dioxygenase family protein [Planctomycetes bacterium]|nr:phytanoyl-CoA dioxygenase family protein [Planctomycetota bacterium]